MAGKGNTHETAYLNLVLNNINAANIGDATGLRGSTVAGNLYVALHTASPGEGGSQTTSEVTYTSYARVAVARDSGSPKWTVASGAAQNANTVAFPQCTAGSPQVATDFSVGTDPSGAGTVLYFGALASSVSIGPGVTPSFAAGALAGTED